jgi:hypothetical protein
MKTTRNGAARKRRARNARHSVRPKDTNGTVALRRQCRELAKELRQVKIERDQYRRSLIRAMEKPHPPR